MNARPFASDADLDAVLGHESSATRARLRTAAGEDPLSVLVTFDDGRITAVARGAVTEAGYCLEEVHAARGKLGPALHELVRYLRPTFAGQRIEAVVDEGATRLQKALEKESFRLFLETIAYERDLTAFEPARGDPVTYRSYDELGKAAFLDALERTLPGSHLLDAGMSARECLDAMIHRARTPEGPFDASLWFAGYVEGDLAGVTLAHVGPERSGALLYAGLVLEHRRRGLAGSVHATTLARLAAAGATTYRAETAVSDRSARRILEDSGCAPGATRRHYLLDRPRSDAPIQGWDALVERLTAQDHAVEIVTPATWLRVPMRFGRDEASLEIGWQRDAGVVQIMHVWPFVTPPAVVARAIERANALNAQLAVPGFVVDATGRVSFRLALLTNRDGALTADALRAAAATVVHTAGMYATSWRLFGSVERTGDLLARVPLRAGGTTPARG